MQLFYDPADLSDAKKLNDKRFSWLVDIGGVDLAQADPDTVGFLFTYQRGESHLKKQLGRLPGVHDRPEERRELLQLDVVLETLKKNSVEIPTPKTWVLKINDPLPVDLEFPLFVRTRTTSWKRGGDQAKVRSLRELSDESELIRNKFGWDAPIIARKWLDVAVAGRWMYGDAPQEVRTWIVNGRPVAWSFHYLHVVPRPQGFPPSLDDLSQLKAAATAVAKPFKSRLIAADFIRDVKGDWHFMEAGPGSVAGTAHEQVFKYVAKQLLEQDADISSNAVGGPF